MRITHTTTIGLTSFAPHVDFPDDFARKLYKSNAHYEYIRSEFYNLAGDIVSSETISSDDHHDDIYAFDCIREAIPLAIAERAIRGELYITRTEPDTVRAFRVLHIICFNL